MRCIIVTPRRTVLPFAGLGSIEEAQQVLNNRVAVPNPRAVGVYP